MENESDARRRTFERDELEADLRELVRAIETLHADPFVGYDSRIALHATVERVVRDLPETMSWEDFFQQAASVVAELDDAHSLVHPPDVRNDESDERKFPLSLRVLGEELYVESVADEGLVELLGARVRGVDGQPATELVDGVRRLRGAENRYGTLLFAARKLTNPSSLARLLDEEPPVETATFEFERGSGNQSVELSPIAEERGPVATLKQSMSHPAGSGPRYRLYEGGDAAVFVPGNLSDYRESLEGKLAADADIAADQAGRAYERHVGGDEPDSVDETIAALPSMTDTLEEMAEEMAAASTDTLIVDLRDNPGGDSQFVFHLAYLLGGWDGVTQAADGVRAVKRRTESHQNRYGDPDEDTDSPEAAAYDFSGFFRSVDETDGPPPMVKQLLFRSQTASEFFDRHENDPLYAPEEVVVVVSAGTMSSAFACAAQLTTLGADIVGVPSGQGPTSFGEHVERTLTNTDLTVRLAGSMYHWLENPTGDVLVPDSELTPERFERYDYADDAALRLAFEHAGYGDTPPIPVDSEPKK